MTVIVLIKIGLMLIKLEELRPKELSYMINHFPFNIAVENSTVASLTH